MKTEWVCTDLDNEQYGRQIDTRIFEFKEKNRGLSDYEEDEYIQLIIDLSDYSSEEAENHISAYYQDFNEVFNLYGEEANWIIAECIFEQESGLY